MCRGKIRIFGLLFFSFYILTVLPLIAQNNTSDDPFRPFLTGKSPRIIKNSSVEIIQGVKVEQILFHSRNQNNIESVIFAAIYRPNNNNRYPGLLILHGGRGAAETEKAMGWAKRGYIVVAPDLPGIAAPEKIPFSQGDWKIKTSDDYISASPDVTASPIFDAVLASVQSLYLLRSQPGVIKDKIGVIGYAWGGYAATMVCGLTGEDVSAAFSVYGTGFYDAGSYWQMKLADLPERERGEWLRYLDAGRRASQIKAEYFLATSTNHPYFGLSAARATLNAIRGAKNQLFAPNADLSIPLPGGTKPSGEPSSTWTEMEKSFFVYHLKGVGKPFPVIKLLKDVKFEADVVRTRFHIEGETSEISAYYSLAGTDINNRQWKKTIVSKVGNDIYEAIIPIEAVKEGADWYVLASSSHPATVSSLIAGVPKP